MTGGVTEAIAVQAGDSVNVRFQGPGHGGACASSEHHPAKPAPMKRTRHPFARRDRAGHAPGRARCGGRLRGGPWAGMIDAANPLPRPPGRASWCAPGEAGGGDEPLLYHVVFAFDNDAHLAAWQDSPRALALAGAGRRPHTVGAQEMRRVSGLDYWFAPAGSTTKGAARPRWKVAVVTWLGIFPHRAAAVPHRGRRCWPTGRWCRAPWSSPCWWWSS